MTTWRYTEDGEWPEDEGWVLVSDHQRERPYESCLLKSPDRWCSSEGMVVEVYEGRIYAWTELPEKAPVREK